MPTKFMEWIICREMVATIITTDYSSVVDIQHRRCARRISITNLVRLASIARSTRSLFGLRTMRLRVKPSCLAA